MSLTQSVWCSIDAMYGSCCDDRGKSRAVLLPIKDDACKQLPTITTMKLRRVKRYFVLINTPYPDDRVSPCGEEPVQRRVELEGVHPIPIILLHLVSNDVGDLWHEKVRGQTPTWSACGLTYIHLEAATKRMHLQTQSRGEKELTQPRLEKRTFRFRSCVYIVAIRVHGKYTHQQLDGAGKHCSLATVNTVPSTNPRSRWLLLSTRDKHYFILYAARSKVTTANKSKLSF